MKTLLLALFALMVSGGVWSQEVEKKDPCTRVTGIIDEIRLKDKINELIREVKKTSKLSEEDKKEIKIIYTDLQDKHNKVYEEIRRDITNGLLFVGKRRLCRLDYYTQLEKLENESLVFIAVVKDKMMTEIPKNKVKNTLYSKMNEMESSTSIDIISTLVSGLPWLIKFVEERAQKQADEFYEQVKWKDYDKI